MLKRLLTQNKDISIVSSYYRRKYVFGSGKLFVVIVFLVISGYAIGAEPNLHRGEIENAKFVIAVPDKFNGKLLLILHGRRKKYISYIDNTNGLRLLTKKVPLYANLNLKDRVYEKLLQQGWMLATTSYRRNGYIIEDAMVDTDNLADYIAQKYGRPERVILQGSSMGGMIATRLAERKDGLERYDGFVCIGAALSITERFPDIRFKPLKPILFLSNQSEITDPTIYCLRCPNNNLMPALWGIIRDGHCNVFPWEHLEAINAMDRWLDMKDIDRFRNATQVLNIQSDADFINGRGHAKVIALQPVYGNIITEFVAEDMERLGISLGERFLFGYGDKKFHVLYSKGYKNVKMGEWVAIMSKGRLVVARNHANAGETLKSKSGDIIWISKVKK